MALNTGDSSLGCGTSVQWSTELPMQDCPLHSQCFSIGKEIKFCLRFSFIGEWYQLDLYNLQIKPFKIEMNYKVTTYIQDGSQLSVHFLSSVRRVSKSGDCLLRFKRSDLTINNVLLKKSIFCLFTKEPKDVSTQTVPIATVSRDLQHLSRDFSSLMKDGTFSDVKLKCGDCTFSAHKSVLAARSEVFAAMFRSKMAESETGVVEVQDLEPDVLEQLLKYVYSGEKPDLCQDTARRLYEATDKYVVYALKKTCSEYMVADMTQENCLDLLIFADEHSDEEFKDAVSRFAADHLQLLSGIWSTFKKEHPELAVEVYDKRFADY